MKTWIDLVVGLAWPAVAVFAIWFFRSELRGLINRVRSAGKGGVEFGPPQPTPRGDPASPLPVSTVDQPAPTAGPGQTGGTLNPRDYITPVYHGLFDEMMTRIRAHLPNMVARFGGQTEDMLVAAVVELGAALHLERACRSIFRSQVEALEGLKWQTAPLAKEAFRPFYDKAANTWPVVYQGYDFDRWFGFLVGMELVRVQDGEVAITQAGQVLARYMADRGYVPVGY